MKDHPTSDNRRESPVAAPARGFALIVTNLTKVGGLIVGINEGLGGGRSAVLAFAAFLIAGGQLSETFLLSMIDRLLGNGDKPSK